ncbi:MAG: hypothetical protein EBY32_05845 [Proteobacteria bacterium]|nr:hypothetical protein [Pseudomonadota bacterium]
MRTQFDRRAAPDVEGQRPRLTQISNTLDPKATGPRSSSQQIQSRTRARPCGNAPGHSRNFSVSSTANKNVE